MLPALSHTVPHASLPLVAMARVPMKSAEEDSAEEDKAYSLPETDAVQTEDLRQKSVPKLHRGEAEHSPGDEYEENNFDAFDDWMMTHLFLLMALQWCR